ncbi:hypothetical protein, partial [Heyndrickxia coagulans]|uniref:hypothetical protein n=1 Tax=Heyndrickxia coagulans TaxID=1398 RepID=UPI001BE3D7C6
HRLCFTWIPASILAFPSHFLFRKKTAPMHFPQQMSIIFALLGFPCLFPFSAALRNTDCSFGAGFLF